MELLNYLELIMAIIRKTLKNGITSITSSFFEDLRLYKASLSDSKQSDYAERRFSSEKPRDFSKIELQTAIQTIILAKYGASEIRDFQEKLKPQQFKDYKFNYGPLKDFESYEMLVEERNELNNLFIKEDDDQKELDRLNSEIQGIDSFVEKQIELVKNNDIES